VRLSASFFQNVVFLNSGAARRLAFRWRGSATATPTARTSWMSRRSAHVSLQPVYNRLPSVFTLVATSDPLVIHRSSRTCCMPQRKGVKSDETHLLAPVSLCAAPRETLTQPPFTGPPEPLTTSALANLPDIAVNRLPRPFLFFFLGALPLHSGVVWTIFCVWIFL